jgi:hypothetical protein
VTAPGFHFGAAELRGFHARWQTLGGFSFCMLAFRPTGPAERCAKRNASASPGQDRVETAVWQRITTADEIVPL